MGAYERSEFATTVQGSPTARRIGAPMGGSVGAWGRGGNTPASEQARAAKGERGSASDSPGGPSWQGLLYLILGHYYFTTL